MKLDLERIERLFLERPRGVRNVGRTTAAVYRACLRAAAGERVIYVTRTYAQTRILRALADSICKSLNVGCSPRERWHLRDNLHVVNCDNSQAIQASLAYGGALADDLGEWADQAPGDPYLEPQVRRFIAGEAP